MPAAAGYPARAGGGGTSSDVATHADQTPAHRVVILGAGRSVASALPSAVVNVDEHRRVLDWLLASFAVLGAPQVHFVGGYRAEEVVSRYPDIRFSFNPQWEATGPARSLALVPLACRRATFVSYSDVLFRPDAVRELDAVDAEVALAVDTRWRVRYDGRSRAELDSAEKLRLRGGELLDMGVDVPTASADAEFAGLLRLSPSMAARLQEDLRAGVFRGSAGIPDIVRHLHSEGIAIAAVDVGGDWAELNAPQDLARFVLGTKAESLERLRGLVRKGHIGELVAFTEARWADARDAVLEEIGARFGRRRLIVRSSARGEDGWLQSGAGAHESVAGATAADPPALAEAVDRVIASYGERDPDNQVLVQELIEDAALAGVLLTRTPTLGAPYYVINFDSTTRRTDSVTAGDGRSLRTVFLHRGAPLRPDLAGELRPLLEIATEVERLVGHDSLDIEFAFDARGRGHVLQVRPIAMAQAAQPRDDAALAAGLADAARLLEERRGPAPVLVGRDTGFSVMCDWNPAEMIGTKPAPLALSLYRRLVTDATWARQRAEAGYRDVRPAQLLVDFLGHPYVDLRVDFNSFVPAALPDDLAGRLVDHYLAHLRREPTLHDKVEFEVVHTCLAFDFDARTGALRDDGFSGPEIELLRQGLRELTRAAIARCERDLAGLPALERRCQALASVGAPLERAAGLLDDARRLGIPAFAHLARAGFVAVALLRSLAAAGVLSPKDVESFLGSLRTVPSAMQGDADRVGRGELDWDSFVARYGHLRPGSYDITSPRYDSAPDEFLEPMLGRARPEPAPRRTPWSAGARDSVAAALGDLDLGLDLDGFEAFLRTAIEGRELAKFSFTRNLSAALEALAEFGEAAAVSRQELSMIRIEELLALRGARAEPASRALRRLARAGREEHRVTQAVCLPSLLFEESDLTCFEQLPAEPNYVTRKRVRAPVACLSGPRTADVDVAGCIVLVPNADPGYDWLFSRDLAGLVTMYGGVNSHMAIRAAEFGLPAAIGVGELVYEDLSGARAIELDCSSRSIQIVR